MRHAAIIQFQTAFLSIFWVLFLVSFEALQEFDPVAESLIWFCIWIDNSFHLLRCIHTEPSYGILLIQWFRDCFVLLRIVLKCLVYIVILVNLHNFWSFRWLGQGYCLLCIFVFTFLRLVCCYRSKQFFLCARSKSFIWWHIVWSIWERNRSLPNRCLHLG